MLSTRANIATVRGNTVARIPAAAQLHVAPPTFTAQRSVRCYFKSESERDIDNAARKTKEAGQNAVDGVQDFLENAKDKVANVFEDAKDGAKDASRDVKSAAKDVSRDAKHQVNKAADNTQDGSRSVVEAVKDGFNDAKDNVEDALDQAGKNVQRGADKIGDAVNQAGRDLQGNADKASDKLDEAGRKVQNKVDDAAKATRRNINSFILAGILGGGLGDLLDSGKDKADKAVNQVVNAGKDTKAGAQGFFSDVKGGINEAKSTNTNNILGQAKGNADENVRGVKNAFNQVKNSVQDTARDARQQADNGVDRSAAAGQNAQSMVERGVDAVKDSFSGVQNKLSSGLNSNRVDDAAQNVTNQAQSAGEKVKSLGRNIL